MGSLIDSLIDKENGNYNYGYSAKIIKERLNKDQLFTNLLQYLSQVDKLLRYISQNRVVKEWKGFMTHPKDIFEDFLIIVSVLLFFLGKEFMLSSLPPHWYSIASINQYTPPSLIHLDQFLIPNI